MALYSAPLIVVVIDRKLPSPIELCFKLFVHWVRRRLTRGLHHGQSSDHDRDDRDHDQLD